MFKFVYDSGLNGKSGVYGQSGLYEKSGLYPVEFNLQNLDPYLLFDTRESMIGTLENPTLDLDPSNPDTLNVITATRSGTATYTDANGNIATAAADTVRVDYTQGEELTPNIYQLVGNTDFTQSHWTKTASTVESGHISPDGTANAYKLIEDTSDSIHRIFETSTVSASPNATISVFVKYSGRRYVLIRFADQSVGRWYDLISGTLGITYLATPNDSTIEAIGNDWYRITLTHTSNAQARCEFWVSDTQSISSYTGDGESGVYLYGPQVEEGTTASDFVANTTGSPKFITGATYGPRVPMILVEPSSENLVTYSEDFSQSSWIKSGVGTGVAPVVTLNAAESPDGTQNAAKIVFDTGSGTSTGDISTLEDLFSATNGASYTQSIYLKGETGGEKILLRHVGNSSYTTVTLTTDWARYEVTETASGSSGYYTIGLRQGLGGVVINSKITVYAYGAQVEAGSVATSYIPTTSGSTATRQADDLQIERDSTNLVAYSEDFSDIYWNKIDVTVAPAPVAAPNGTMTASHVVKTGSNAHINAVNIGASGTHTQSIWARTVSGTGTCFFDFHAGTPSTVTEEWQRFEVPSTTSNMYAANFRGTSTLTEIYIWGAQLELGDTTSYIPTSGAAASRTTFSDFFNSGGDGTFYAEFITRTITEEQVYVLAGSSSTQRYMYSNVSDANLKSFDGYSDNFGGDIQTTLNRASISYNSNTKKCSLNGSSDVTHVGTGDLQDSTRLSIGQSWSDQNHLNGHIKRLIYWPLHSDSL